MKQNATITFKATNALKKHIEAKAKTKGMSLSAWLKAVIKKQTGFKEPDLNVLIAIIGLFIMASCVDPFDHPYRGTYNGYEIKDGNNYASNTGILSFNGHTQKFDFILFPNCFYAAKDSAIHKIYGFSDITQKNSMRIGWRARQDSTIDLFAYWHKNGKFGYQWMGNTELDVENKATLKVRDDRFIFQINDKTFEMKGSINGLKHRLFPYFEDGRGKGAPHKMTFYVYEY